MEHYQVSTNGESRVEGSVRCTKSRCVIQYTEDAFVQGNSLVKGRRVSGEAFLKALCVHSSSPTLHCTASTPEAFAHFASTVYQSSRRTKEACWVRENELRDAPEGSCLLRFDPAINPLAWRRAALGDRSYSLCGVTHTLCSHSVMDAIGDLLLAPVHAWDALVCTSQAVLNVVESLLAEYGEYLRERMGGGAPSPRLQLPVIPLGVDCDRFAKPKDFAARRHACRAQWHAKSNEIVLLFVGRVSFHAKANPYPLFVAANHVRQQTGKKIRIVLAGQVPNASIKGAIRSAFLATCPKMQLVFAPFDKNELWEDIWYGADVFVSLVDNIQETFGLTPLEAMSARQVVRIETSLRQCCARVKRARRSVGREQSQNGLG